METKRRICLYGNSMIVGMMGASLRRSLQYEIISLPLPNVEPKQLKDINPDAILFDLEITRLETAFSWLTQCPDLLLIGVSPDNNLVRMWSGRQLQELSTRTLLDVINEQLKNPMVP